MDFGSISHSLEAGLVGLTLGGILTLVTRTRAGNAQPRVREALVPGTFVTYRIQFESGSWAALRFNVRQVSNPNEVELMVQIKTPMGEGAFLLKDNPNANANDLPMPAMTEVLLLRGPEFSALPDVQEYERHPRIHQATALNLLLGRPRHEARFSPNTEWSEQEYVYTSRRVYRVTCPLPHGTKWYDCCPDIPITGVAAMGFVGGDTWTVTAFGADTSGPKQGGPQFDYVDVSSPVRTELDGWSIVAPPTWFFDVQGEEDDTGKHTVYQSRIGGGTNFLLATISIYHRDSADFSKVRSEFLERVGTDTEQFGLRVRAKQKDEANPDDGSVIVDQRFRSISGIMVAATKTAADGERLATILLMGNVDDGHPQASALRTAMEAALTPMLASFEFGSPSPAPSPQALPS